MPRPRVIRLRSLVVGRMERIARSQPRLLPLPRHQSPQSPVETCRTVKSHHDTLNTKNVVRRPVEAGFRRSKACQASSYSNRLRNARRRRQPPTRGSSANWRRMSIAWYSQTPSQADGRGSGLRRSRHQAGRASRSIGATSRPHARHSLTGFATAPRPSRLITQTISCRRRLSERALCLA
jgi:hypothetical protein